MFKPLLYLSYHFIVIQQCRLALSYLLTFGVDLNWKERLYITISGFPKATVQASIFARHLWVSRATVYSSISKDVIETNHFCIFAGGIGTGRTRPRPNKKSSAIFWSGQRRFNSKRAGNCINSTLWSNIFGPICAEIPSKSASWWMNNVIGYLSKLIYLMFTLILNHYRSN